MERWPFFSPRFPIHIRVMLVTRVSTCLEMMAGTSWKEWRGLDRTVLDYMELDAEFWTKCTMNWTSQKCSDWNGLSGVWTGVSY